MKDQKLVPISMRMPADVIAELKELAPRLGLSGYQALIKFYVSKGLREQAAEDYERKMQAGDRARKRRP